MAAAAMIGFSRPTGREGDRRGVVSEGPEEVAADRGEGPAGERDRVGRGAEVAGDESEVARLDRDVGAGADRDPEVGLRERGRVVHAVADDRDVVTRGLQLADDVHLLAGQHAGHDPVDADGRGDRGRGVLPVTGHHDRLDARAGAGRRSRRATSA